MNRPQRHRLHHPEAPAGHGGSPPVLAPDALARLQQLDPDGSRGFVAQVLRTYAASLERYLLSLHEARDTGNLKLAGDTAHTLKSSSAAIGAAAFAAVCADIERQAHRGDTSALGAPLSNLLDEAARVQAAVRAMLPA